MIDKNKAYRFRGDSERWEFCKEDDGFLDSVSIPPVCIGIYAAHHLHERGILLEYPELPGEDWEFCEAKDCERVWCDEQGRWDGSPREYWCSECGPIYCRKKKPVYRSGEMCKADEGSDDLARDAWRDGHVIYWTTDPEKGKELLS